MVVPLRTRCRSTRRGHVAVLKFVAHSVPGTRERSGSWAKYMAQITFLATDADCDTVWEMIFAELRMVAFPDPWFGNLPPSALRTPVEVSANLAEYPRVAPALGYFLTSPDWSIEPLEYRLCENNPSFAPHWCVSQRYGGPSIHFIPRFGYPWHKECEQIISGMFSDYPYYYSGVDHREIIERPAGLVATMKSIRQKLRSLGKTVRARSGELAIAMGNALTAYDAGVVLRTGNIIYSPVASRQRTKHCT